MVHRYKHHTWTVADRRDVRGHDRPKPHQCAVDDRGDGAAHANRSMNTIVKSLLIGLGAAAVVGGGTYVVVKASHCVEDLGSGQTVTFDGIDAERGCLDAEKLAQNYRPGFFPFRRVDDKFPQPPIVQCQATETQQWAGMDVDVTVTWRVTTPLSTNGKPPPTAEEARTECAFLFLHGPSPHPQLTP
jgi:hypothetical protein